MSSSVWGYTKVKKKCYFYICLVSYQLINLFLWSFIFIYVNLYICIVFIFHVVLHFKTFLVYYRNWRMRVWAYKIPQQPSLCKRPLQRILQHCKANYTGVFLWICVRQHNSGNFLFILLYQNSTGVKVAIRYVFILLVYYTVFTNHAR